VTLVK